MSERVKGAPGWRRAEMDVGHTPNVTAPDALADLIHAFVTEG